jgi:hypothetical protein
MAELVNHDVAAHEHPILDVDMAAQEQVRSQRDAVAEHAVVCDVRAAHEVVVVADDRDRPLVGPAVEPGVLPEDVAIADAQETP